MREFCRVFGLLLYKNLLVRTRHWKMALIVESLIPIGLVMMMQAVKDFAHTSPLEVKENAYNSPDTEDDLLPGFGDLNVLYTPSTNLTKQLMEGYVQECLRIFPENLKSFDTEQELLRTYTIEAADKSHYNALAVTFHKELSNQSLIYTIRHNGRIPKSLYDNYMQGYGQPATKMYFLSTKFTQLQMCLDKSFVNRSVAEPTNIRLSIQEMPYPAYVDKSSDVILRMVVCMFTVIAFLIPLCIEANYPAKEKNIGVNTLMYMNGITSWQNLLSWLLTATLFSALYVIPITLLFKHSLSAYGTPYMQYGNAYLFCMLLFTHAGHLFAFGIHVSAYFSQPRYVVIALSILYMGSFSLQQNFINRQSPSTLPILGVLFPNVLLYRSLEEINVYEMKYSGLQWRYVFTNGDAEYNSWGSAGSVWLLSIFGMTMHFLLANYVNAVLPGKYGVPKRPLYFLQMMRKNKVTDDEELPDDDCSEANGEDFEVVAKGTLTPGIQIRGLKKSYKTGWIRRSVVHALRGISVDLYKNQITTLLGHNGAGKTTLMSILTGVAPETSGKIIINGMDIAYNLDLIRRDFGLCPQENMFFPDLNVFEQIQFFGLLKGIAKSKGLVERKVNLLLENLKLSEKKYVLPDKLSGGQKRRLCLGMALIGDSSILMLDEPTSGMDPETKRATWDILLKMRGNKTIIVSTHDMEEADILGDRVAIVHTGRMVCYGTSMFLKKQYGHGNVEITLSTKPWCDPEKVINKFGPSVRRIHVDSEKIVLSAAHSDGLPETLDEIESDKEELNVTGIDVSLITLEQVFLKVKEKEDGEEARPSLVSATATATKLHGWRSFLQSTVGLFDKKLTYTKKDTWNVSLIIILPLISTLLMSLNNRPAAHDTSTLQLSVDMYGSPKALVSGTNRTFIEKYQEIVNAFGGHASDTVDAHKNISKALLSIAKTDLTDYRNNYVTSAEFRISEGGNVSANGLYSKSAVHSLPLTVNLLTNTLVRVLANDEYSIRASSQRFPPTLSDTKMDVTTVQSLGQVLTFTGFFFAMLAIFVVHPAQENTTIVKQLQRMTGITSFLYWNVMLLSDLLIYVFSVLIMLCGLYTMDWVFGTRLYTAVEIPIMLLIMVVFGVNGLLVTYIFSFIGKSRNTVLTLLCLVPYGLVLLQYLLHNITLIYASETVHDLQKRIFRLIPYVSLFHGQMSFHDVAVQNARCRRLPDNLLRAACRVGDRCCGLRCSNGTCAEHIPYFGNFKKDLNLEESLLYMAFTPILYYCMLIALEEKKLKMIFSRITAPRMRQGCENMDDEVKAEKRLIALEVGKIGGIRGNKERADAVNIESALPTIPGKDENENLFLAYELSKRYGRLTAVKEVSFRVKQRECFGLLGVNGAGKSTTFRMLTGEEAPDSGLIYLNGWEIKKDRRKYLPAMGYCPQTDALIDSLNAFDHLRLFARLRGIPSERVDSEVLAWIDKLNLHACKSQPSGTYSGGNKRRLNIAMALIGGPTLVLLDEPTTGVDPAARRSLWNVVRSCQAAGQAIILTSHSMQECEVLCNRLAIMVRGELVCVGASQELKNRFGAGYDIHVKLNPGRSDEDVNAIKRTIESTLSCDVRDENVGLIAYHVSNAETWQRMYGTMKSLKDRFSCIEDYSVLSATLEQLFMQFARAAEQSRHTNDHALPKHSSSQAIQV